MCKRLIIFAICLLVGAPSVAVGDIAGSAHDFSGSGWSGGEICIVCHTPHHADTAVTDSPLWNHMVTAAEFDTYASPWLQETPLAPQGVSKLCLSCHDGTIALDNFGGMTGGSNFVSGDFDIGTDLQDDHPVSIEWRHQTDAATCGQCHDIHGPVSFVSPLPFFDGYVECASCHDVHDGAGFPKLLRMSLSESAICLHCHGK